MNETNCTYNLCLSFLTPDVQVNFHRELNHLKEVSGMDHMKAFHLGPQADLQNAWNAAYRLAFPWKAWP